MPIRLILTDDHAVVLEGLHAFLKQESDFDIVACCTNGEATIEAVREHKPDVLVLDLSMRGMDGFEVLRELHHAPLVPRVVLLTASICEDEVLEAFRFGVAGIVLKEMAMSLLVRCIRTVHGGGRWLEKDSTAKAIEQLLHREAVFGKSGLTPRELDIVRAVAHGGRTRDIAQELHISEATVKTHLGHIYDKLNVESRAGLIILAKDTGLIGPRRSPVPARSIAQGA